MARIALAFGMAFAALACATPIGERELEERLASVAAVSPGAHPRVFPVWAGTRLAAWTLLADARGDPRSPESLRLGHAISRAATQPTTVVVGGPYADLSDQIVRNALEMHGERALGRLTIVLVGPEPPSAELSAALARAGARIQHRPLE